MKDRIWTDIKESEINRHIRYYEEKRVVIREWVENKKLLVIDLEEMVKQKEGFEKRVITDDLFELRHDIIKLEYEYDAKGSYIENYKKHTSNV